MSLTLAPEHCEDLKKSGLTDSTIEALQVTAVRPHDLKHLKGVTSAYRIPYFHPDGTPNDCTRLKLFPPITTRDGRIQKYHQPPGSSSQLYLPPLGDWKAVMADVTCDLYVVEGEKKAAALCQRQRPAIGVAGVWNWRQRHETGERLVIPTVDQFVWTDQTQPRTAVLIPDSDGWRDEKRLDVLGGFYALGQELVSRGATVQLLQLPERGREKVGLDDWLVSVGDDWEHQWPHLARIPLDDARLAPVASWWQKWRERQATQDAIKSQDTKELEVTEAAGLYSVRSPTYAVTILFDRLTDKRDSVYAEVTVTLGTTELLSGVDVGLKSDTGQSKLAGSLKVVAASVPWKLLLQKACSLVLKRHRSGEPIIPLTPSASAVVPFLLNPLIYQGHQTLVYAPGGSCKSYLALWFALLACHGGNHAGVAGLKVPVLYLDWELNAETIGGRLKTLQAGHPGLSTHTPFYRRCELPLDQEAHTIAAFVAAQHVKLLIIDSAAMACGGELSSPEAAITLQRALRKINCASLVLAHTSKAVTDGHERTAFGTVFFRELARNVWELAKSDEENPVKLALSHTKYNFSPKQPTLGFSLTFSAEQVRIEAQDLTAEPEFQAKLPTPARIRNLLADGELRTSKDIADELGLPLPSTKAILSKYGGHKWSKIGDNRETQWTVLTVNTDR